MLTCETITNEIEVRERPTETVLITIVEGRPLLHQANHELCWAGRSLNLMDVVDPEWHDPQSIVVRAPRDDGWRPCKDGVRKRCVERGYTRIDG